LPPVKIKLTVTQMKPVSWNFTIEISTRKELLGLTGIQYALLYWLPSYKHQIQYLYSLYFVIWTFYLPEVLQNSLHRHGLTGISYTGEVL